MTMSCTARKSMKNISVLIRKVVFETYRKTDFTYSSMPPEEEEFL